MTSITSLSDSHLLLETERRTSTERAATLAVLHCLQEIEARQLFSREGFPSLFEMCLRRFGYSEAAALRRIDAMRLLKNVPELEMKIETGELKLSQLAQVQAFLRIEKKDAGKSYTREQTLDLVSSLAGRSTRDTERLLLQESPAMQMRRETSESIRPVTATHTEVKIVADEEFMNLLEEARGLFAHCADMHPSAASLLKKGLQALVAQKKKQKGIPDQTTGDSPIAPESKAVKTERLSSSQRSTSAICDSAELPEEVPASRYIPAGLKRAVLTRARGQCEFKTRNGLRCTTRHAIELHHHHPYARGGAHTLENISAYCKGHNAAQARWDFAAAS